MSYKVQGITIRNFKNIMSEKIQINGNNVYVLGRNQFGKTTFLDAIFKPLSGKNMPPEPVTQGQKSGSIEIDMGEFLVVAKFNSKGQKVAVEVQTKEGATYPSPRKMLDDLCGVIDFDLSAFFRKSAKEQVDFIKQLADVDFSDLDDEYKKLYDERTYVNKQVKELEVQAQAFDKDNITPVDISEETKKLNEKREYNESYDNAKRFFEEKRLRMQSIQNEISELEKRAAQLREEYQSIEIDYDTTFSWLNDPANAPFDISAENAALLAKIEQNKVIEANIKNKEYYDILCQRLELQKSINTRMEDIETIKRNTIAEANLPVPGLSFNDNELTYNGLPFSAAQLNTATQIIIGLQINLWLLKDVKIARFEGSLIDDENMEYILDWAEKNDLQLFVEIVDRTAEKLKIEVKEVLD